MSDQNSKSKASSFEQQAQAESTGLASEFFEFLRANKKWWLLPILGVLLIVGLLVVLGGTAAAPFIYTLF
jgi:uncharacterized protein YdaL